MISFAVGNALLLMFPAPSVRGPALFCRARQRCQFYVSVGHLANATSATPSSVI